MRAGGTSGARRSALPAHIATRDGAGCQIGNLAACHSMLLHACYMLRRVGGWTAGAVTVFAILLAAGEGALKTAHLHWPQPVVVMLGALATALVGTIKPLRDAVSATWAKSITSKAERRQRHAALLQHVVPGRRALQRVRDMVDARATLGIHRAIPLSSEADGSLSRELPLYVPRDVHAKITTWITANKQKGGFLLLVGPAGAGKTRCLYEALHDRAPDALILIPQTPDQLEGFVDDNDSRDLVVVWLDEIYNFLGPGKLSADLVRRMLNHSRPMLIASTIWDERFRALTTTMGGELDSGTYEILTRLCELIEVPAEFSPAELERAESLAKHDPRLKEALEAGSDDVASSLAAKPQLLAHWSSPSDAYEHAVLTAAIAARQCGHPESIPVSLLEPLALQWLDSGQRGQANTEWFKAALAAACLPIPGFKIAALEAQATVPGRIEGYRAHDILVQYVSLDLSYAVIQSVIEHASSSACYEIGFRINATHGDLAKCAYEKALEDEDSSYFAVAAFFLGHLLMDRGEETAAQETFRRADGQEPKIVADMATYALAKSLDDSGDIDGAKAVYRQIADSDNSLAIMATVNLANILHDQGDTEGALVLHQLAADSDDPHLAPTSAMISGLILQKRGDLESARMRYQQYIDSGHEDKDYLRTVMARLEQLNEAQD